jgi:predicted RNase H-like nuclease (RuvC/YqgF family)
MRSFKKTYQPNWVLRATITRRDKTILQLKQAIKMLKSKLRKSDANATTAVTAKERLKVEREKSKKSLKKLEKEKERMCRDLTVEFEDYVCQIEELEANNSVKAAELQKHGRAHSDLMHVLCYACLTANTPVDQVPGLIQRIVKLLNIEIEAKDIPNEATVSIWALELGLWSDLEACEILAN